VASRPVPQVVRTATATSRPAVRRPIGATTAGAAAVGPMTTLGPILAVATVVFLAVHSVLSWVVTAPGEPERRHDHSARTRARPAARPRPAAHPFRGPGTLRQKSSAFGA